MQFEWDDFADSLNQAWRCAMHKVADASIEVESLLSILEAKARLDPAEQTAKRRAQRR